MTHGRRMSLELRTPKFQILSVWPVPWISVTHRPCDTMKFVLCSTIIIKFIVLWNFGVTQPKNCFHW